MFETAFTSGKRIAPSSEKEGRKMKILMDKGCYELFYDQKYYDNLEFIRIDSICGKTHITMKNILTEEIMTFEQENLKWVKKKAMLTIHSRHTPNQVADSHAPLL